MDLGGVQGGYIPRLEILTRTPSLQNSPLPKIWPKAGFFYVIYFENVVFHGKLTVCFLFNIRSLRAKTAKEPTTGQFKTFF
jgi:hypothetical protein